MIQKLRNILSIEQDEYFSDETLLQYINKAENNIVSLFISRERSDSISYRALDKLREVASVSLSLLTISGDIHKFEGVLPEDLQQFTGLYVNDSLVLRELTGSTKIQFLMGNARPNNREAFYQIITNRNFVVYTNTNSTTSVVVNYIKKPLVYLLEDTEIKNLPIYLENAVLYYAAYLAVTQENVAEAQKSASDFYQIYTNELQIGNY